jgi:hypothetical protein
LHWLHATAFLILLAWLHTNGDNGVIELTEEGVVFFYYSLLATAIIFNNPWLLGISVAACLLSRYSFIGWIPFAVLYLVLRKEYKFLLRISIAAVIVALILILPFGLGPLLYHLHLPDDYIWLIKYLFTEVLDGRNESLTNDIENILNRKPGSFKDYVTKTIKTGIWK